MYKILSLLVGLQLLAACGFDYSIEEFENHTPQLVLNSFINPANEISVDLSWSRPANQTNATIKTFSATVELYEDDKQLGTLEVIESEFAQLTFTNIYPKAGSRYKLIVTQESGATTQAETTIPQAATAQIHYKGVYNNGVDTEGSVYSNAAFCNLAINAATIPTHSRALWIKCGKVLYEHIDALNNKLYSEDILGSKYYTSNSFVDQFNLKIDNSNAHISGGSVNYEKFLRIPQSLLQDALTLDFTVAVRESFTTTIVILDHPHFTEAISIPFSTINVEAISPSDDYDQYVKTAYKHFDLSTSPDFPIFSDNVRVYSNVKNGLGIFAGYNITNIKVSTLNK